MKGPHDQAFILSSPAFTGTHVHSFFLPDRPTHLHEREGNGKRNILLGWPKYCNNNTNYMYLIMANSSYNFTWIIKNGTQKSLPKEIKYSMTVNLMEETQLKVLSCMHIKQENYVIKREHHSKCDIKGFRIAGDFLTTVVHHQFQNQLNSVKQWSSSSEERKNSWIQSKRSRWHIQLWPMRKTKRKTCSSLTSTAWFLPKR